MNVFFTSNVIVSLRPDMFPDLIAYRRVSDDEAISWDHERTSGLSFGETARCLELEVMRFHGEGGVTAVVPLRHCRDGIDLSTVHFVRERDKSSKIDTCDWCGLSFPNLLACSICKRVLRQRTCYCSRECQKAAWPQHKHTAGHSSELETRQSDQSESLSKLPNIPHS